VLSLINPEVEKIAELPSIVGPSLFTDTVATEEGRFFPVYPESRGVTSRWFYHALKRIFASGILEELVDPIPKEILKRYNLPTLGTALVWIHSPRE
jgi:RecG-like helicase